METLSTIWWLERRGVTTEVTMRSTKTYRVISTLVLTFLALLFFDATTITAAPGDLDLTFGVGGRIYPPSGSQTPFSEGNDLVIQPDQKILVSASHFNHSNGRFELLVSRYLPNGNLDPTFGVGGNVFNSDVSGGKLALQSDGKILVAAGQILRYLPDGNLDAAFDGDGVLQFSAFGAYKLAIQNDGKIIVAGTKYIGPGNFGDPSLFGLARLNSDGSFDTTFGSNGIVNTAFPYPVSYLGDILIQGDNKIVAAGSTHTINGNGLCSPCNIALSRYNVDGSLDTSFGTSGRVVTPGGPYNSLHGSDVTLQADNKIVVAGHADGGGLVIRYMPDGLPDASFGSAGQVSIPNLCPFSIAVQSNGKIVVAGGTTDYDPSNSSHELGRLLSNGALDPTFGTNGRVTTVFPNLPTGVYINGRAWGMAIQRDGKIATVGNWSGTDWDGNWYWSYVAIARFLGDPTPTCPNPIDCADFFVSQHYRDFLNREPDPPGLTHWTSEITECSDPAERQPDESFAACTERKRANTSAAFFLSPEFQNTGSFLLRVYWGTLGKLLNAQCPGVPNGLPGHCRPRYSEYINDMATITREIVVNDHLDPARINAKKHAFVESFVTRPEFRTIYDGLNNTQYVDKLFETTGISPSSTDRQELINGLTNGTENRASVAYKIVDGTHTITDGALVFDTPYGEAFYNQEFDTAFVMMEYLGYLRRNPDQEGYDFWLAKMRRYGNWVDAQMVLAFTISPEYRSRFGTP